MKNKTPLPIKKMMRKFGDTISILSRTETTDTDGRVKYTYPSTLTTYGYLYAASGLREGWFDIGFAEDIDYVVCVDSTITVNVGDLIVLSDTTKTEVRNKLPRTLGYNVDYLECLCKKVE